jgi:NAD(P)-dependent dehydrogenase (short-subunit alcohol dehydrogenase family)
LEATSPADPAPLTAGAKILVTGGARGITAAIAIELARRFRPTLILVGRSPLPPAAEEPHTLGLKDQGELKAALIQHLSNGKPPRPADVEKAYQRLLQEREIRDNLATMRAAGATVEYFSVDVRDEQALERLIADVRARHGHLDGVLHGAGVIEDKLLRDKTPESFDRVFRTKVDSAFALCRHLQLDELKFLVFFASLASRYGNRGQSDYAAANEVLSKLAVQLDRQLPARVFSVAWGPWAEVGMVAELEPHLTRRGLKLISPSTGPAFLIDELLLGRKGTAEIVVAGGAERLVAPVEATG